MKKQLYFILFLMTCLFCCCGGAYGGMVSEQQAVSPYIVYVTAGDGVNLRESPDVSGKKYLNIPAFVCLEVTAETDNGWGYTSFDGQYGWIALSEVGSDFPYSTADKDVVVSAPDGGVNFRSGPHVSYSTLTAMIPNGTTLHVTRTTANNWGYTTYNGINGWIALSQVSNIKSPQNVNQGASSETAAPVTEPEAAPTDTGAETPSPEETSVSAGLSPLILVLIGIIVSAVIIAGGAIAIIMKKKN